VVGCRTAADSLGAGVTGGCKADSMSRSLSGDPTGEEIQQAKGFIRQSAPWLDEDELTETASWLAQRAAEYHWMRALHLKPAQEKRALRKRAKALQALEKSARALRM